MNNNIQYIVLHSTQTQLNEPHFDFLFHYVIDRNGDLAIGRKIAPDEKAIHIAYVGGIDSEKKVNDTRTEQQCEFLFGFLLLLVFSYPDARIFSANTIFGESNDPGFNIADWIKNYTPKVMRIAA